MNDDRVSPRRNAEQGSQDRRSAPRRPPEPGARTAPRRGPRGARVRPGAGSPGNGRGADPAAAAPSRARSARHRRSRSGSRRERRSRRACVRIERCRLPGVRAERRRTPTTAAGAAAHQQSGPGERDSEARAEHTCRTPSSAESTRTKSSSSGRGRRAHRRCRRTGASSLNDAAGVLELLSELVTTRSRTSPSADEPSSTSRARR